MRAAPERARVTFYRTATGVEVNWVLELPGNRLRAIEIKRGLAPKVETGLRPERTFLVYSCDERYSKGDGIEAIGVRDLAAELAVMPS